MPTALYVDRNPTGWNPLKYLICPQYWITALLFSSKRQIRKATPVDSIAYEAMGYPFEQEDSSTRKGRPILMRERAVSLQRQAHSQSSLGSHRESKQQDCGSVLGW